MPIRATILKELALFGVCFGIVFMLLSLLRNLTFGSGIGKIRYIEKVNDLGFRIRTLNFNRKKKFNDSIFYNWIDVKSVKLSVNFADETIGKMSLSFGFSDGKRKIKVDNSFRNFYYLLRNIPKGYDTMDYDFVENLFKDLKTCSFCGLIAYHNGECLDCYRTSNLSEKYLKKHPNIEEIIKKEQLELFSTPEKDEIFNDFKIKSLSFKQDENWKPLVTKQEVLQYSKENYWK